MAGPIVESRGQALETGIGNLLTFLKGIPNALHRDNLDQTATQIGAAGQQLAADAGQFFQPVVQDAKGVGNAIVGTGQEIVKDFNREIPLNPVVGTLKEMPAQTQQLGQQIGTAAHEATPAIKSAVDTITAPGRGLGALLFDKGHVPGEGFNLNRFTIGINPFMSDTQKEAALFQQSLNRAQPEAPADPPKQDVAPTETPAPVVEPQVETPAPKGEETTVAPPKVAEDAGAAVTEAVEKGDTSVWADIMSNPDVATMMLASGTALLQGKSLGDALAAGQVAVGSRKKMEAASAAAAKKDAREERELRMNEKKTDAEIAKLRAEARKVTREGKIGLNDGVLKKSLDVVANNLDFGELSAELQGQVAANITRAATGENAKWGVPALANWIKADKDAAQARLQTLKNLGVPDDVLAQAIESI